MSLISEYAKRYDLMAHHGGSMDTDCQGSKFHSPTPLRVTPTYLSQVVAEAIGEPSPAEKPEIGRAHV